MTGELSRLKPPGGATKKAKHKGRGIASGNGKTAGRGMKGQKARKSGGVRPGFEGGQMPMQRRLPKRGFKNLFKKQFAEVSVAMLNRFEDGATVDEAVLREAHLVHGHSPDGVKIIGKDELTKKLTVKVNRITAGAKGVIEGAGGTVELIPDRPKWKRGEKSEG
jgi:large subunit ribosomal protein L15